MTKPYQALRASSKRSAGTGVRWEIAVPAITAVLTLVIGAELNSFESRRLERKKFQFEVLKYTLSATDEAKRVRLLCEFADLGFIDDPDHQYQRKEISGSRPCASSVGSQPFSTSAAYGELRTQIGRGTDGGVSIENGFFKVGGGLADYHDLENKIIAAKTVPRISVGALAADARAWSDDAIRANRFAASSHLIIQHDGHLVQPRNIFDRAADAPVVLLLQTGGRLGFGPDGRGQMDKLRDQFGRRVDREEGVGFIPGMTTTGRQRFSKAQIANLTLTINALCRRWPDTTVGWSNYVSDTLKMQGVPRPACVRER